MIGSGLKNFLLGGTRVREMLDTARAWDELETLWQRSPLSSIELSDLVIAIVRNVVEQVGRTPVPPLFVALCEAVEALYRAENLVPIEPVWPVLKTDVEAVVEFREMMGRRRAWLGNFQAMHGPFLRIVQEGLVAFLGTLPESCWDGPDASEEFETPLIDLLEHPARVVDQLFLFPYEDEAFRLDLFHRLRELCATNLMIASGFSPDADIRALKHKLIRAPDQKDKTGAELSALYLRGSPFRDLLDVPVPFHIPQELRFEHCHIVGGTGHGKTQLMQKMIHADLMASREDRRSVVVIDSQGDLINKIVRLDLFAPDVRDSLAPRLVLIDPSDVEFPAALNLFDAHLDRVRGYGPADQERVLNGVIELYELFFGSFLGAELTQKQGVVFKYLARLMLAIPGATIHTLMQIMEDGARFKPYMERLDGSARHFFETEFFHPAFASTKKQVLRRLWGVLSTPAFERMFTQPENKLDLFEAMNEGKIILVSTAKDLLKREGSQLLGRFFVAMITQAALERSTLPERLRNPTFVYVDEAQEYFDDSIETILTQARKYKVGLTLAHQTLDQLSPRLRSAILANTSVKCAGGVSAKDARSLAEELRTTAEFITSMKRRGSRSEFAVWVKHQTGQAIRLSIPLGFLEGKPTLDADDYDLLLAANRTRYCGTLAALAPLPPPALPQPEPPALLPPAREIEVQPVAPSPEPTPAPTSAIPSVDSAPLKPVLPIPVSPAVSPETRPAGKGGKQHRYLQQIVKQLAEEQGLKATIEASLPGGEGQVDVLIERDDVQAAVEISVTTSVEWERANLAKCLAAGYPRIAVVIAKSKRTSGKFRDALRESVPDDRRENVSFLDPEDIPAFIASLAPPSSSETVIKGYRVRVSQAVGSPEAAGARRQVLARIIAQSLTVLAEKVRFLIGHSARASGARVSAMVRIAARAVSRMVTKSRTRFHLYMVNLDTWPHGLY